MSGYIYVARDARASLTKIGYSQNPVQRVRQIGRKVALVLTFPGDRGDEGEIHRRLEHRRFEGEWFDIEPADVVDVVVAVWTRQARDAVDFGAAGELLAEMQGQLRERRAALRSPLDEDDVAQIFGEVGRELGRHLYRTAKAALELVSERVATIEVHDDDPNLARAIGARQ